MLLLIHWECSRPPHTFSWWSIVSFHGFSTFFSSWLVVPAASCIKLTSVASLLILSATLQHCCWCGGPSREYWKICGVGSSLLLEILQELVPIVKCWNFNPKNFRPNGTFVLFVKRNGMTPTLDCESSNSRFSENCGLLFDHHHREVVCGVAWVVKMGSYWFLKPLVSDITAVSIWGGYGEGLYLPHILQFAFSTLDEIPQ